MSFEVLRSPVMFLQHVGISADQDWLREYEAWFEREGQGISDAVDRAGTPWLRMFDRWGARVDEILYPPEYWRMLKHGYRAGVLWRVFEQKSLLLAALAAYGQTPVEPLHVPEPVAGFHLLYELKFEESRNQFETWQKSHPEDPLGSAIEFPIPYDQWNLRCPFPIAC